jgi:hypothetical protein
MKKTAMQTLEDQIAENMVREIQEEIDWSIMTQLYVDSGYTEVIIDRPMAIDDEHNLRNWVEENRTGFVCHRNWHFIFEHSSDAVLFKLRWER